MNVQIAVRRISVSQTIKQRVHELCMDVHNRYKTIQNIDVFIEDINGPYKAGIDKRCHLRVRGTQHLSIDVDEIDADLSHVIDHAFSRLYHMLKRKWSFRLPRRRSVVSDPRFWLDAGDTNEQ